MFSPPGFSIAVAKVVPNINLCDYCTESKVSKNCCVIGHENSAQSGGEIRGQKPYLKLRVNPLKSL